MARIALGKQHGNFFGALRRKVGRDSRRGMACDSVENCRVSARHNLETLFWCRISGRNRIYDVYLYHLFRVLEQSRSGFGFKNFGVDDVGCCRACRIYNAQTATDAEVKINA